MKSQGELVEIEFMREMYSRGYVVSKPFGDNAKYDFIVDKGGTLTRVQVKSTDSNDKTGPGSDGRRYRVLLAYGNCSKRAYTKKEIDAFAVFVIPDNAWYFIPVEEVKSIRISLLKGEQRKFTKKSAFPYESWKFRFDVFG